MLPFFRRVVQVNKSDFRHYKTVRARNGLQKLGQINLRNKEIMFNKRKNPFPMPENKVASTESKAHEDHNIEPPIVAYKLDCPGCGAKYQYKFTNKPGYLHYDTMISWDSKSSILCERCTNVSKTEYHQMYSINEERFKKIIRKIGSKRSLGIIVCDIIGFPATLPPDIEKIYPPKTPIVLCLNKCDVLASNEKQLMVAREYYRDLVYKWEATVSFTFSDVMFTSARTGTGLPELSLLIQQYMYDMEFGEFDFCYLLGVTNAGKSTMFNKLSPLLNNRMRCIGNVTESPLPGTTVNHINTPIDPPMLQNKTEKSISQKVDILQTLLANPRIPNDSRYSDWFKYKIDLQLKDTSRLKMLIDTPGVLPENSIPEATYTCQSQVVCKNIVLYPGQCLSFGWYKVYYVRGNTSIHLRINSPMVSKYKVLDDFSDNELNCTEDGIELSNKLYVMQNINNKTEKSQIVGDIVLGNFAWVAVGLAFGDDVTMCVFGPRLEDICYRTPSFQLKVPRATDHNHMLPKLQELDNFEQHFEQS